MKDKLKKIPIGKLFMEIFSVVLAVLVALAVNEWRTNRSNQQTAANALENIIQEIKTNQEEIRTSLDEHLPIQQTLRSTRRNTKLQIRNKKVSSPIASNMDMSMLS